jgi:hypothetical protein
MSRTRPRSVDYRVRRKVDPNKSIGTQSCVAARHGPRAKSLHDDRYLKWVMARDDVVLTKPRPAMYVAVFADAARLTLSADAIGVCGLS